MDPEHRWQERLLARTHALQGFHFIEHHHQARKPAVAKNGQKADQKVGGSEVVQVTFDAGGTLDSGRHVGLPPQAN